MAGTNKTGTPEAGQIFRSIVVAHPVGKGSWTLKLQNHGEAEREVILSTWSNAN